MGLYKTKISRAYLIFNVPSIRRLRDAEFWEEADVLKPERFEGFNSDRKGFRFLPFGVGRRACPAAGLAMRVMAIAVGALVQCFEWEKAEEGEINMRPVFGVAMTKAQPLVVLPKPRPEMVPTLSQPPLEGDLWRRFVF